MRLTEALHRGGFPSGLSWGHASSRMAESGLKDKGVASGWVGLGVHAGVSPPKRLVQLQMAWFLPSGWQNAGVVARGTLIRGAWEPDPQNGSLETQFRLRVRD